MLYASRTGTRRNLRELAKHGWRLLVSATGVWRPEGFRYALDNGAWTYHAKGEPFDFGRYLRCVRAMGPGADWAVLPDVVGDAAETHAMSRDWLPVVAGTCPVYAAIQDGARSAQLDSLDVDGLFLGGSDSYKEQSASQWGAYCRERRIKFHIGRVNTRRRIVICASSGADSIDGSSATRFAVNVLPLTRAASQGAFVW